MLGIVVIAVGCDKTAGEKPATSGPALDLNANPDLLFHVFGERAEPKMMPIAAIQGNSVVDINLPPEGWRALDAKYLNPGASYPIYRDGRAEGTVTILRGMWTAEPMYSLPGCAVLVPMASVALSDTTHGFTVDQFATTRAPAVRPRTRVVPVDTVRAIAKRIGYEVGRGVDLDSLELETLDFRAIAIETGTNPRPTIVLSFIDPRGGDVATGRGNTATVFVVADDDGTGYKASFRHAVNGDAANAEYRSFLDHLDLTGDGIDELLLEGWHFGAEAALRVLAWRNGTWREVFVGRSSWCVDAPKR